jgi:hypothetical protein
MRRALVLAGLVLAAAVLLAAPTGAGAQPSDFLHVTSNVKYSLYAGQEMLAVSWDVTIQNNDPATQPRPGGPLRAYESFRFPVLRGAAALSAESGGAALRTEIDESPPGPIVPLTVYAPDPLFFGESLTLRIRYLLTETRHDGILITAAYAFLPVVASGDEARVEVTAPSGDPWQVSLEPAECTQSGAVFSCAGSDSAYLAALVEVSRPDLTSTTAFEAPLRNQQLPVSVTYFQGDEQFARRVTELTTQALPVIEDLFGVPYSGPPDLRISEGGRQVTLGYEGVVACDSREGYCRIVVSPVASDHVLLHELAHLFTGHYQRRWLREGFADYMAAQAAARLPEGLVQGGPPLRPQPTVDLQLDEWGDVQPEATASEAHLAVEAAGYYRAERFFAQLDATAGLEAIRRANQLLSGRSRPADSRDFMDALEEAAGPKFDELFLDWVFPAGSRQLIADRRAARDRFNNLLARAQEYGLADGVPREIESAISEWRFDDALAALDEAEADLEVFPALKADLDGLRADAEAAGLQLTDDIDTAIAGWEFGLARNILASARSALDAYLEADEAVHSGRSLWERFGLLGKDPDGDLERAADAFNAGRYAESERYSKSALDTVEGASAAAARRLLVVVGVLAAFALVVLTAVALSRWRDREFIERA